MQTVFEKIIEKLENYSDADEAEQYGTIPVIELDRAIEIVKQEAEQYNNGWIPCNERLPDDFMSMEYLTTVKGHFYPEINYYCVANHKWFSSGKTTKEVDVIAWQSLPQTFQPKGE